MCIQEQNRLQANIWCTAKGCAYEGAYEVTEAMELCAEDCNNIGFALLCYCFSLRISWRDSIRVALSFSDTVRKNIYNPPLF